MYIQLKKKHGSGRQPLKYMIMSANSARWLVYGQHKWLKKQKQLQR